MMDCQDARTAWLEWFDAGLPVESPPELQAHVAGCSACARFAAVQRSLDIRLTAMFAPPVLSAGFRPALLRRVRRESARPWSAALPEIVHVASCGAATAFCAVMLPFDALTVLGAGAGVTVFSCALLGAVRDWLDEADGLVP